MAHTPGQTQTPLVCIIEDEEDIRELLRMLLEEAGYRVTEAADGLAGYTLLRDAAERVIALVDHRLPRLDGCDLLELIAGDERLLVRHAFIFITGNARHVVEEDCGEALDELDAQIMAKPFDIDDVIEEVRRAAERLHSV
jgi:CheY-like chemotaxis protein